MDMTTPTDQPLIVTVTPTVMDGTVVRWYATVDAEDRDAELASASRNRAVLAEHAPSWLEAIAYEVHRTLRRDPRADLSHLATHKRRFLLGPLEPIATPAS